MSKYKVQIDLLTRYVKSSRGFDSWFGLGYACELNLIVDFRMVNDMFSSWDGFSGELAYPVKSPTELIECYDFYSWCDNKHDRSTEYGKARLSLAKHCLKYLQDLENKNDKQTIIRASRAMLVR